MVARRSATRKPRRWPVRRAALGFMLTAVLSLAWVLRPIRLTLSFQELQVIAPPCARCST